MSVMQGPRVLIVDDDPVDRELMVRGFRKARLDAAIETASDGAEALDKLRSGELPRPLMVLLDFRMPGMDGPTFLRELRADAHLRDLPVIVVTTSEDDRDVATAYDHNVVGYIPKGKAGHDYGEMVSLIEAYWRVVRLPA